MNALELSDVRKIYTMGDGSDVVALDHATLTVADDEIVALVGPSGSGKTTLCSIAGGILSPTEGKIVVAGEDISDYGDKQLTKFRQESIGFVFQSVNLVPFLNAKENLTVVDELGKRTGKAAQRRADQLLEELGLGRPEEEPAVAAVGRPAAAGRDRAGADERSEAGAVRRADLGARHRTRRAGDGADPHRDEAAGHLGDRRHPRRADHAVLRPQRAHHRRSSRGLSAARAKTAVKLPIVAAGVRRSPRLAGMVEMSDGRSARRERNRDAVLDALVELTTEGADDPSIDDIADRAGVSYRSVYRYFKDRSEMMDAATDRAMSWIQPLVMRASGDAKPTDPLDHRIDAIVDARVELYFQIADMVRAAMVQSFSNRKIHEHFQNARRISRGQIHDQFHNELKMFTPQECELRITSIDQVLSFQAVDYVMHERNHSREELERYLRGAIRAALTVPEVGT